jgi:predicted patatin/cPLA2 family phospholipase
MTSAVSGDPPSATREIVDLLRARGARGGGPPFGDGARIALAVEGGAMRGVVSAGMVSALEALGLNTAFDAVYGSSAGAINGAYLLTGQAALGASIYYQDINTRRFVDARRAFSRRPVLNLSFLLDDVMVTRKPLDAGRVLHGPTPLVVLATHVASADGVALRDFGSRARLVAALRASATMPVVAGDPADFEGALYLDASLTEPIPLPTAEADGHTHVLVLLTRPDASSRRVSLFDRTVVLPRLRRLSSTLATKYIDRAEPYASLLDVIAHGRGPLGRAVVAGIRPEAPVVRKLERDADRLRAGALRGFEALMAAFGSRPT